MSRFRFIEAERANHSVVRMCRQLGVSPKWVLARYRLHDIVTELDEGYAGTISDLAHRYGWYDQAHLTREFTALVGETPGRYRDGRRGRPPGGDDPGPSISHDLCRVQG